MSKSKVAKFTLMDAKTTTGHGEMFGKIQGDLKDYTDILITVTTGAGVSGTLEFAQSKSDSFPDFAAAITVTNEHAPIAFFDEEDGSLKTSLSLSASATYYLMMNTNATSFISANLSIISGGAVTVKAVALSHINQ